MGKIFHRFLLIIAILITLIFTVSFFMNGGVRKWDEQVCINLFIYIFCTSFLIFVIIWVVAMVVIFFAILMIKSEL